MGLKDLKEAIEKDNVVFGLRESLKSLKGKKKGKLFVVSDARDATLKKVQEKGEIEMLKKKQDVSKELGLDFECEVFLLK